METIIINGRKIRDQILAEVAIEVGRLPFQPVFCDVLIGNNPVSRQYVEMKAKTAEKIGIKFHKAEFPEDITADDLIQEITKLKNVPNISGVIVQLPLPAGLVPFKQDILDAVPEYLDVDCLGSKASEKFYEGKNSIGYPTALACMHIFDTINTELHFSIKDKKIVVLGRGDLVGKPVSALLHFAGFNPLVVSSKTENKDEILKSADLIISGIGKGKFLTGEMLKKGVIIIDAGTSESNDTSNAKQNIVGDVELDSVLGLASYISPVPGGVGPITVAMLLKNVLKVAKNKGYE
ncbi:MAG: bifunctional 5,10-methylenetetrahydrofolate dehydrogenase/5,10-methenyltetrahydrofolate cyclohydrolase [Candidatus Pacebacteria bacterium]|nr:bifunctional 5,10-methylenetetrahydrofolate dehydrogenase/5,10-methenyltetrahydrofolate cyclohydrolase [Candidatus Paceibacterota bacterium]MCF7862525.1 bifunctional 5,10-methylenetetrahydrofolate dehydrogenase/5,10-methenyltetrahydrofolate cyclohydrolase [Candidatus Paceibacterota bacterium]